MQEASDRRYASSANSKKIAGLSVQGVEAGHPERHFRCRESRSSWLPLWLSLQTQALSKPYAAITMKLADKTAEIA
jgi:hypothetical protein